MENTMDTTEGELIEDDMNIEDIEADMDDFPDEWMVLDDADEEYDDLEDSLTEMKGAGDSMDASSVCLEGDEKTSDVHSESAPVKHPQSAPQVSSKSSLPVNQPLGKKTQAAAAGAGKQTKSGGKTPVRSGSSPQTQLKKALPGGATPVKPLQSGKSASSKPDAIPKKTTSSPAQNVKPKPESKQSGPRSSGTHGSQPVAPSHAKAPAKTKTAAPQKMPLKAAPSTSGGNKPAVSKPPQQSSVSKQSQSQTTAKHTSEKGKSLTQSKPPVQVKPAAQSKTGGQSKADSQVVGRPGSSTQQQKSQMETKPVAPSAAGRPVVQSKSAALSKPGLQPKVLPQAKSTVQSKSTDGMPAVSVKPAVQPKSAEQLSSTRPVAKVKLATKSAVQPKSAEQVSSTTPVLQLNSGEHVSTAKPSEQIESAEQMSSAESAVQLKSMKGASSVRAAGQSDSAEISSLKTTEVLKFSAVFEKSSDASTVGNVSHIKESTRESSLEQTQFPQDKKLSCDAVVKEEKLPNSESCKDEDGDGLLEGEKDKEISLKTPSENFITKEKDKPAQERKDVVKLQKQKSKDKPSSKVENQSGDKCSGKMPAKSTDRSDEKLQTKFSNNSRDSDKNRLSSRDRMRGRSKDRYDHSFDRKSRLDYSPHYRKSSRDKDFAWPGERKSTLDPKKSDDRRSSSSSSRPSASATKTSMPVKRSASSDSKMNVTQDKKNKQSGDKSPQLAKETPPSDEKKGMASSKRTIQLVDTSMQTDEVKLEKAPKAEGKGSTPGAEAEMKLNKLEIKKMDDEEVEKLFELKTNAMEEGLWRFAVRISPVELGDVAQEEVRKLLNGAQDCVVFLKCQGTGKKKKGDAKMYFTRMQPTKFAMQKVFQTTFTNKKLEVEVCRKLVGAGSKDTVMLELDLTKLGLLAQVGTTTDTKDASETPEDKNVHISNVPKGTSQELLFVIFPTALAIQMEGRDKGLVVVQFRSGQYAQDIMKCYVSVTINKTKVHLTWKGLTSDKMSTPSVLQSDTLTSLNVSRPFSCTICNFSFSKRRDLARHMKKHGQDAKDLGLPLSEYEKIMKTAAAEKTVALEKTEEEDDETTDKTAAGLEKALKMESGQESDSGQQEQTVFHIPVRDSWRIDKTEARGARESRELRDVMNAPEDEVPDAKRPRLESSSFAHSDSKSSAVKTLKRPGGGGVVDEQVTAGQKFTGQIVQGTEDISDDEDLRGMEAISPEWDDDSPSKMRDTQEPSQNFQRANTVSRQSDRKIFNFDRDDNRYQKGLERTDREQSWSNRMKNQSEWEADLSSRSGSRLGVRRRSLERQVGGHSSGARSVSPAHRQRCSGDLSSIQHRSRSPVRQGDGRQHSNISPSGISKRSQYSRSPPRQHRQTRINNSSPPRHRRKEYREDLSPVSDHSLGGHDSSPAKQRHSPARQGHYRKEYSPVRRDSSPLTDNRTSSRQFSSSFDGYNCKRRDESLKRHSPVRQNYSSGQNLSSRGYSQTRQSHSPRRSSSLNRRGPSPSGSSQSTRQGYSSRKYSRSPPRQSYNPLRQHYSPARQGGSPVRKGSPFSRSPVRSDFSKPRMEMLRDSPQRSAATMDRDRLNAMMSFAHTLSTATSLTQKTQSSVGLMSSSLTTSHGLSASTAPSGLTSGTKTDPVIPGLDLLTPSSTTATRSVLDLLTERKWTQPEVLSRSRDDSFRSQQPDSSRGDTFSGRQQLGSDSVVSPQPARGSWLGKSDELSGWWGTEKPQGRPQLDMLASSRDEPGSSLDLMSLRKEAAKHLASLDKNVHDSHPQVADVKRTDSSFGNLRGASKMSNTSFSMDYGHQQHGQDSLSGNIRVHNESTGDMGRTNWEETRKQPQQKQQNSWGEQMNQKTSSGWEQSGSGNQFSYDSSQATGQAPTSARQTGSQGVGFGLTSSGPPVRPGWEGDLGVKRSNLGPGSAQMGLGGLGGSWQTGVGMSGSMPPSPGPGMQGSGIAGLSGPVAGAGMAGPGMFGPGIPRLGMSGPNMSGPGMSGPGLPGPGMMGPGMMGPGLSAPGMLRPGSDTWLPPPPRPPVQFSGPNSFRSRPPF